MERSNVAVAFLAGVCVALGVALIVQSGNLLPRAHAQAAGGAGEVFAVSGTGTQGQGRDVLFVVDSKERVLAVYEYKEKRLSVGAIRKIEYDLQVPGEYPKGTQTPSVNDMKKALEKKTPK